MRNLDGKISVLNDKLESILARNQEELRQENKSQFNAIMAHLEKIQNKD